MIKTEYKFSEITSKIIGAAFELHMTLGNGFQEFIYHKGLIKEMSLVGLSFVSEFNMPIVYKGEILGNRRVDFLVEEFISVEIKAVSILEDIHLAQAINYLEAYNLEIGLL